MKKVFDIFRIRRDERWLALAMLVFFILLNSLTICKYYGIFTPLKSSYWALFVHNFIVSGFDPITYAVVSDWSAGYNVYRHPFLAFFMYVPYLINRGLMLITGINCAVFIVAAMQVCFAFYSAVFMSRILREVIGLRRFDANLLTVFFCSFAYIMLASMVPDHFIGSMFLLLMAVYISGRHIRKHDRMGVWQTVLLFLVTAGITLSNGVKVFIYALFVNGRRFFNWKYLLLAVVVPSAFIWMFARYEYKFLVWPGEMARHEAKVKKNAAMKDKIYKSFADTTKIKDSLQMTKAVNKIIKGKASAKYKQDHKQPWNAHAGKPIANGEFMRWTDKTTSRLSTVVENLAGESVLLHQDHLLEDTMRSRPVVVHYKWVSNYIVEGLIVFLFLIGVLAGCRSRFLWMVLAGFGFDLFLHLGLGFGINEVYIMGAHWLFAIPIAIAFFFKSINTMFLPCLRALLVSLTAYLLVYNIWLISGYFM